MVNETLVYETLNIMNNNNLTIQIIATIAAIAPGIATTLSAYVAYKNFKLNEKTRRDFAIDKIKHDLTSLKNV